MAVAVVLVATMGRLPGWSARAVEREERAQQREATSEARRFVDVSVRLRVVAMDLEHGEELIEGGPRLRIVREYDVGGIVDTAPGGGLRPYLCGKGANPAIWYTSEAIEPLIRHGKNAPRWTMLQGGEGVGKSTALAQWVYFRFLQHLGHPERQIGIVAPDWPRMGRMLEAIARLWRADWMESRRLKPTDRDKVIAFRGGPSVMFVGAHEQSEAKGSPIQGFNWVACAPDELQDCHDKWADMLARLRAAPDGRGLVMASCTAKDATAWRTFKDAAAANDNWQVRTIPGVESPFVHPDHWASMKNGGVTLREWLRRVMAVDVGPEAQVYHCFRRKLDDGTPANLRPVPLGAQDCTAEVLAASRPQSDPRPIGLLLGHDPGKRQHVTEFLKAYRFPEDVRRGDMRPRWFVVDEVTTPDATVHEHAQTVLRRAQSRWRCNLKSSSTGAWSPDCPQVLVRIDPHSRAEKSDHPGPDVKTIWLSMGMLAKAAAYKPGTADPGIIPKDSRINMVNTLLCATGQAPGSEVRRLFIACDDSGNAAAPKLLAAFESMERDAGGEAETERKDANDLSHWPCALGYALWMPERARVGQVAA